MCVKSYKSKVVISGDIIEIYDYVEPVLEGYSIKEHHDCGRNHVASDEDRQLNREKIFNRAKRDIRRLVNTNIKYLSKFVTLTFADNVQEFEVANNEFNLFIKRLNYRLKMKVEYLCVPEFQKRGAIHYHVIMFNVPYIKSKELSEVWGHGYVKINRIDTVDNVGAYVCKYMSKAGDDDRLQGKKCYFTSRNLDKPIEIKENSLVESVRNSLQADSPSFESTFENDYNSISYRQYNKNKSNCKCVHKGMNE